ncbi:MAG: hypothetical protein H6Q33_5069, partial [Deltaproteobacteria bacterium]|nr:hypothetical protein [Deltaproteobacteria bacterium]
MPYAQSSSRARVRTAEALAGLVDGAWE